MEKFLKYNTHLVTIIEWKEEGVSYVWVSEFEATTDKDLGFFQ